VSGVQPPQQMIEVGRIGRPHGVRGWVRIDAATRPPESILEFRHWWLGDAEHAECHEVVAAQQQSGRIIARLQGIEDREAAAALRQLRIWVPRAALPPLAEDEWYWADLIGLRVETRDGTDLGSVDSLLETGANDVLVVAGERERLIPWIQGEVVVSVDLSARRIVVDWDPEF